MTSKKDLKEQYKNNLFLIGTFGIVLFSAIIGLFYTIQKRDNFIKSIEDPIIQDQSLPTIEAQFSTNSGNYTYTLEIADDNYERSKGLMNREELSEDEGMLFIFDKSENLSFWMKNTYIPLDIIFLSDDKKVVKIHEDTKTNNTSILYTSESPAKYTIELNSGQSKLMDLEVGNQVYF